VGGGGRGRRGAVWGRGGRVRVGGGGLAGGAPPPPPTPHTTTPPTPPTPNTTPTTNTHNHPTPTHPPPQPPTGGGGGGSPRVFYRTCCEQKKNPPIPGHFPRDIPVSGRRDGDQKRRCEGRQTGDSVICGETGQRQDHELPQDSAGNSAADVEGMIRPHGSQRRIAAQLRGRSRIRWVAEASVARGQTNRGPWDQGPLFDPNDQDAQGRRTSSDEPDGILMAEGHADRVSQPVRHDKNRQRKPNESMNKHADFYPHGAASMRWPRRAGSGR